jgi:zinc ribbon protein
MRVFNGRKATEDYMSTHSLTFSTPEMTLKKFALWLGEQIDSPNDNKQQIPRLLSYLEDKDRKTSTSDYVPDVADRFEPSGAVTDMYRGISGTDSGTRVQLKSTGSKDNGEEVRFCIECGSKLRPSSKFCIACGQRQS